MKPFHYLLLETMNDNPTNKVIYLKSLVKNYKPKTETFSKEILKELEAMGIDLVNEKKPTNLKADKLAGRTFILDHMEEFINHAVDYSMVDKIKDIWHEPKDLA